MRLARLWSELNRPPLWQVGRLMFSISRRQAFLDHAGWILRLAPSNRRRSWALRVLSLSPHYFIYQWTQRYAGMTRDEILEAENARNANSREAICEELLHRYLTSEMTVLDFGCGPGYLAKHVSQYVSKVLAVDISRGTIACAKELNGARNIEYLANHEPNLAVIKGSSIDFLYSIAVIQHLDKEAAFEFFREFSRVLKPRAMVFCHFNLTEEPRKSSRWQLWFRLRATYYTRQEMEEMARRAGFSEVSVLPIRDIADIEDDVGRQHVALLER